MNGNVKTRNILARGRLASAFVAASLLLPSGACSSKPDSSTPQSNTQAHAPAPTGGDASKIIERYRALDSSSDSTVKLRARITADEASEPSPPKQLQLTMYRKRESDGRTLILVEFTAPPEERDRDGLITVFPDGRIEGVRYVQSTDSYIVTDDPMSEDALFGMTLQELAGGQAEKYDFRVDGEETQDQSAAYRLEGTLKPGVQSKFRRLLLFVDKSTFAATKAEFYDNHNELARRLSVSKTELVGGYWTRTRWDIDNLARQTKIAFDAVEVRYDQNLSDSIFTREHLKKISSR